MATQNEPSDKQDHQGVRFASQTQEFDPPDESLRPVETLTAHDARQNPDLNPDAEQELLQLKTTLRNNIQSARMQHHNFEPVSLPGSAPMSRVGSGATTPARGSMLIGSADASPKPSPTTSAVQSPPLTPSNTSSRDGKPSTSPKTAPRSVPDVMTPQRSTSPQREKPAENRAGGVPAQPKPVPTFTLGPPDSETATAEASPSSTAPGTPSMDPTASRPSSPLKGQPVSELSMEQRFRFGNRDPAQGWANSGQSNVSLPTVSTVSKSHASGSSLTKQSKRASFFGGGKKHVDETPTAAAAALLADVKTKQPESKPIEKASGSKSNLKRFFNKFGDHHKKDRDKDKSRDERHADTAAALSGNRADKDGTRTPPSVAAPSVPFADDHGLENKYGKFGRLLGAGAGGSVRLMKRTGDGRVFAVKQFRDRHAYESEKEYNKKVTAEFCIGSTLHHGNVIETIDIAHEKGKWYEVMEYAPYDLFATVMTGKMSRDEVTCATLQIISGVCYLHMMGLAHRDLKLDNVVINEHGIMKLIDFGSAVVFRYPFENDVVLATGVVGSDPYLAPEVYDNQRYDPRLADIWSIAIIYCCMTLRRFPWKAPRLSDSSYRLFVAEPDPDQDKILDSYRKGSRSNRDSVSADPAQPDGSKRESKSEPATRDANGSTTTTDTDDTSSEHHRHHHHHHHRHHHNSSIDADNDRQAKSEPASRQTTAQQTSSSAASTDQAVIKGPMRLLRLLPRETRHIIGRMLALDPRQRADMDEVLRDPWVENALVCRQDEDGTVYSAPNHLHTLQPGGNAG